MAHFPYQIQYQIHRQLSRFSKSVKWLFRHPNILESSHQNQTLIWLLLSLFWPVYFGGVSLHYTLNSEFIVQDDARQHVVWLQRFYDPELFQSDLIADYFQSLAPVGYRWFYHVMASVGIEPINLAKIAPLILGIIATLYFFRFSLTILPLPASAYINTLIFNQLIWLNDDLISATPRAFVYPLFAIFLFYLAKRSFIPLLICIPLQGLFYPQLMLVEIAVLTLRLFHKSPGGLFRFSPDRYDGRLWLWGWVIALMVLLLPWVNASAFGPLITAAEMKQMPEFSWQGRSPYFGVNPLQFILSGSSGLNIPLFPSIIWISAAFPLLLRSRSVIVRFITKEIQIIWQVAIASLSLFLLAHIFLPQLHLPSRYVYHSFKFLLPIMTGISLLILLNNGWLWLHQKYQANHRFSARELLLIGTISGGLCIVVIFPAIPSIFIPWFQNFMIGDSPNIYQYLIEQPKDTLVASLAQEADNLPTFTHRSVLIAPEFSLAYHRGYYQQFKQRVIALIKAHYTTNSNELISVINQYKIDYILIENHVFDVNYLLGQFWLVNSSYQGFVLNEVAAMKAGKRPALARFVKPCSVASSQSLKLLGTKCILEVSRDEQNSIVLMTESTKH